MSTPRVSIVIPTYNEQDDIRSTLESVIAVRYPDKEILVIDDSNDNTPSIVREYADHGVRLLSGRSRIDRRAANTGGARNVGIREATGEILVFFNADNRPAPDYLERLMPHYERGADYVFGTTEVLNQDSIFGRYIGATSHVSYDGQDWIEWEDGFSCRREAALAVNLFPELPVPMSAAEDGVFGFRLSQRFNKVIDRSIVVRHVAPSTLRSYWEMRKARGRATPVFKFFIAGQSIGRVFRRVLLGTAAFSLQLVLVAPVFATAWAVSSKSPRRRADVVPFVWAVAVELVARMVGEWESFLELVARLPQHQAEQAQWIDRSTAQYFATAGKRRTSEARRAQS